MKSIFKTIIIEDVKEQRKDIQSAVEFFFRKTGLDRYECRFFSQEGDSILVLAKDNYDGINESDIAFIDFNLGSTSKDGLQIAQILKKFNKNLNIVFVSAQANFIDIKRQDPEDVISYWVPKPISKEIISNCLSSVIFKREAVEKESVLETKVDFLVNYNFSNSQKIAIDNGIVYDSKIMEEIILKVCKIAPSDTRVLITGSNGTGKEGIARMIHNLSPRKSRAFIDVNCAAIPSELIESELFGHEKGSFTSAFKQRIGKFEQADGGTLFLDEVSDMSLSAQAKVLRALQENKITRVGDTKDIPVNVRVIAATNKDIHIEIKEKRFREDLFYRISVISLQLPTLNQRGNNDIRLLADYFIKKTCNKNRIDINVDESILDLLCTFKYNGNIRQLENIIEASIALSNKKITSEIVREVYNASRVENIDPDIMQSENKSDPPHSNKHEVYYPHQLEEIKNELKEYENTYNELFAKFLVEYQSDKVLKEPTIRDVSEALGHSYNYITERYTGSDSLKDVRRDKTGFLLTNDFKSFKIIGLSPFKKIIRDFKKKGSY